MPSISSDRINYLVWRYFKEEGLALSAYSLDKEANTSDLDAEHAKDVAEGSLVKLLLKGMQMVEVENAAGQTDALNHTQLIDSSVKATDPVESSNISETIGALREVLTEDTPASPSVEATRPSNNFKVDTSNFKTKTVERVALPNDLKLRGGIDSIFNSPSAFVVMTPDSVLAYLSENETLQEIPFESSEKPTCLEPLGISLDGSDQSLLVGYASGVVRQWGFSKQGSVLQSVLSFDGGSSAPVLSIKTSPSGMRAAVADTSSSGVVNIWDLRQRTLFCHLALPSEKVDENGTIGDMSWIKLDTTLAVSYASGIAIYRFPDETTTEPVKPATWLEGHKKPVANLAFELATRLLASGGDDGRVCIWDAQSDVPVRQLEVSGLAAPVSHTSWLGVHLLTGTTDGMISVWDLRTQTEGLRASVDVGEPIFSLQVSKSLPPLIAAVVPSGVKAYKFDLQEARLELVGEVSSQGVECVSWGNDQCFVVSNSTESVILRCPI